MVFEHVFERDLAQGSYLVGCERTGEAAVIDARRDVEVYLRLARAHRLRIREVTETHVHADYLSGSRELAARTGATLHLSAEGGPEAAYDFDGRPLYDGDRIRIGDVVLEVLHTPGHTPEHLSFLITDEAHADRPSHLLTGDFVFVGDVGRPDLLDEVAGGVDTRYRGARQLFESLSTRFLALPDWVQVWPGHGAGSACGKALGAVPSTTVGYERRVAWWSEALHDGDHAGFERMLLEGQPDAPGYFGRMKRWNRQGPPLLDERDAPRALDAAAVARRLQAGEIALIDARPRAIWQNDAIRGALHVPYGGKFATYAAWAFDPEADRRPVALIADDADQASLLRDKLAWSGIDRVEGFVADVEPFPREPVPSVTPAELDELSNAHVLDLRGSDERARGAIPGSRHLHAGQLPWRLDEIPRERTVVTHCQGGARSAVGASVLRAHGFPRVLELAGGYEAWASRAGRDAEPDTKSRTGP